MNLTNKYNNNLHQHKNPHYTHITTYNNNNNTNIYPPLKPKHNKHLSLFEQHSKQFHYNLILKRYQHNLISSKQTKPSIITKTKSFIKDTVSTVNKKKHSLLLETSLFSNKHNTTHEIKTYVNKHKPVSIQYKERINNKSVIIKKHQMKMKELERSTKLFNGMFEQQQHNNKNYLHLHVDVTFNNEPKNNVFVQLDKEYQFYKTKKEIVDSINKVKDFEAFNKGYKKNVLPKKLKHSLSALMVMKRKMRLQKVNERKEYSKLIQESASF